MAERIDLFDSTYGHFTEPVLEVVRKETFGVDIGQNSWVTVDEYERFIDWLGLAADHHAIEVACGSGGPALRAPEWQARLEGCAEPLPEDG